MSLSVWVAHFSRCDLNTPRRPGLGGRGGEEAFDLQTPLHMCCSWGLENVVQCLIEHEADVNVTVCKFLSLGKYSTVEFLNSSMKW